MGIQTQFWNLLFDKAFAIIIIILHCLLYWRYIDTTLLLMCICLFHNGCLGVGAT